MASGQAGRPEVTGRVKNNLVRDDQQQRRGGNGQHARCRDNSHCHAKGRPFRPRTFLFNSTFGKIRFYSSTFWGAHKEEGKPRTLATMSETSLPTRMVLGALGGMRRPPADNRIFPFCAAPQTLMGMSGSGGVTARTAAARCVSSRGMCRDGGAASFARA
jgi:hypothetical protein